MKIVIHDYKSSGTDATYDLTTPAELRNFLSQLATQDGFADSGPTVSMSADAAYMLAALAARKESLPRTDEERRAHAEHTGGNHV